MFPGQGRVTTAHQNLNFVDSSQSVTMSAGQTESAVLELQGSNSICGISIPGNFQGSYIRFQADFGDGLTDLVNPDGTYITAIVQPLQVVIFPLLTMLPVQKFVIITDVAQVADGEFRVITRYAV